MPLNDMSLDELALISAHLVTLETAGRDLVDAGLDPRFDMTPGEAVTITTSFRMPAVESPKVAFPVQAAVDDAQLIQILKSVLDDVTDAHVPITAYSSPFPDAPLYESPPRDWDKGREREVAEIYAKSWMESPHIDPSYQAAEASATPRQVISDYVTAHLYPLCSEHLERLQRETPSAAPSRSDDVASPPPEAASSEGAADSGGGQQVMAAATPPAAAATNERTFSGTVVWTPEEDARLIDLVVMGITRLGLTKGAAMKSAAHELARPEAGTAFRCHHKLKDRLDAALAQDDPTPLPERTEVVAPDKAEPNQSGGAAIGGHSPEADQVTGHILSLSQKNGWTLERDLELIELSISGWQPNEIALQLQIQANLIKPRFDALTGLFEDATGKKLRRFTREAVFATLTRLTGKAA